MLDMESFKDIESYLKEEDARREDVINTSRIILKNSKSAIYSLHRKELEHAGELIDESKKLIARLQKIAEEHPHLKQNMENALEEYCEACCFYGFVKERKIPTHKELGIEFRLGRGLGKIARCNERPNQRIAECILTG